MARQRGNTAKALQLVVETPKADAAQLESSSPNEQVRELIRLLARRAARDFINAETKRIQHDHLPG